MFPHTHTCTHYWHTHTHTHTHTHYWHVHYADTHTHTHPHTNCYRTCMHNTHSHKWWAIHGHTQRCMTSHMNAHRHTDWPGSSRFGVVRYRWGCFTTTDRCCQRHRWQPTPVSVHENITKFSSQTQIEYIKNRRAVHQYEKNLPV